MAYQPNFNDSRVLASAKKALNFVELYIKTDEVSPISSTQLYKHFGNTSRPLSRWLVEQLLVVRDPYYNMNTGVCKKYSKNNKGVKLVKQLAGLQHFEPKIDAKIEQDIATGCFEYEEKSNRLFTPAQNIPKRYRDGILANHGYKYHYDIKAAAATLLYQRARQLDPTLNLINLEYYINNRSLIRTQIAQECEISESQSKTVLNAILQGGVISSWVNNRTFTDLNYNYDAVIKLKHNQTVIDLKEDIRKLWKILARDIPVRYLTDKNGNKRKAKISGSTKSSYYRELEKTVGDQIRKILRKNSVRYLWIHDGWCCDKIVDPNMIVSEVRRTTSYSLELDWSIYEDS